MVKMSIEKKEPTDEFYKELDNVIKYQIKSLNNQVKTREAFAKAVEISRKQGFSDMETGLLVKEYFKDKLPKTTYYRTLHKLKLIEKKQKVPLEQMSYNNVLDVKHNTIQECLADAVKEFTKLKKVIHEFAEMLEKKINENIDLEIKDKRYDEKKYLNDMTDAFHNVEKAVIKASDILEKEQYSKQNIIDEIKRTYIKLCADEPNVKLIDPDVSYIDYLLHSHYKGKI
jgi:hypothetical protein